MAGFDFLRVGARLTFQLAGWRSAKSSFGRLHHSKIPPGGVAGFVSQIPAESGFVSRVAKHLDASKHVTEEIVDKFSLRFGHTRQSNP